jgi:hypothetical protein
MPRNCNYTRLAICGTQNEQIGAGDAEHFLELYQWMRSFAPAPVGDALARQRKGDRSFGLSPSAGDHMMK